MRFCARAFTLCATSPCLLNSLSTIVRVHLVSCAANQRMELQNANRLSFKLQAHAVFYTYPHVTPSVCNGCRMPDESGCLLLLFATVV